MRLEITKEELKVMVDLLENEFNIGEHDTNSDVFTLFTRCARAYYSNVATNALQRSKVYAGTTDGSYKRCLASFGYDTAMSYLERI